VLFFAYVAALQAVFEWEENVLDGYLREQDAEEQDDDSRKLVSYMMY